MAKRNWIHVDKDKCTGCRMCELACSFRWEKGRFDPESARIRVRKEEEKGIDAPTVCRQCKVALCAKACPLGVITFAEGIGAWIVDAQRCTGCGLCVEACPFDSVFLHPVTGMATKCDLCRGQKPACVEACPTGAITLPED